MRKTAIVYASVHHKNTEKLLRGMVNEIEVELIDLLKNRKPDLSSYEVVGFASGIYAARMHKSIENFVKASADLPKKTFVVCTSGVGKGSFAKKFAKRLKDLGFEVLGSFECKGFDTFGPLKLVGGLGKGRPNQEDIENGRQFLSDLCEQMK